MRTLQFEANLLGASNSLNQSKREYLQPAQYRMIYMLLGMGRSTYEGTLGAVFAEFFPQEREGAFANIILSTGLASVVGFWLAGISPFVIEMSSILAIMGFWKANAMYIAEQQRSEPLPSSEDDGIS
jgi:hypothetical protein